jgi:hypothetical protein
LPDEVVLSDETRVILKQDLNGDGEIRAEDYEVFGGLRGRALPADTDVLFESVIYWHYDPTPCYGEDGWEAAVEGERARYDLTEAEWLQLVEDAGYDQDTLDQEYQRVLQCLAGADEAAALRCSKELSMIEYLIEARELLPGANDDGLSGDGETPVTMGGEASDLGVTAGPNFQVGRRTWTDIFDE